MANQFQHNLKRLWNIYPKVNRTKNISQESAEIYLQYRPGKEIGEIRTVDLEVLYAEEGKMVGGGCEMRSSWKFNELKPRFYYAQGGRDYFASRYIKSLAVALMDSIGATKTDTRRNPDFFVGCDPEDYLATWDLTAFTSTLHELRFFLYWMTRALEDRGDVILKIVDYGQGLQHIKASELLYEYNETVNIQAPFSIHRIIDKYGLEDFDFSNFEQQNSGMLGVAGNIGFSTALHGYAIESVSEQGKSCSVGDDAIRAGADNPEEILYPQIQKIGILHPEKTSVIHPWSEGVMKFLKRRLDRTETGFRLDFLFKLPLPVLVDKRYGGRTPPDLSWYETAKKVATTIGQLVWSLTTHWDNYVQQDLDILHTFLYPFYNHFGFKTIGSLPNQHPWKHEGQSVTLDFAYPPINFIEFSPFQTDWLEWLLDRDYQSFQVPVLMSTFTPQVPSLGETYYATQDKGWKMLEDLGYLQEGTVLRQTVSKLEGENRRRFVNFIHGLSRDLFLVYSYTCIKEIPEQYHFLYAPYPVTDFTELLDGI